MKYLSHKNPYEISYIQFETHFETTRTYMQSKECNICSLYNLVHVVKFSTKQTYIIIKVFFWQTYVNYSPVLSTEPLPLVSHPLRHACIHLRTDKYMFLRCSVTKVADYFCKNTLPITVDSS